MGLELSEAPPRVIRSGPPTYSEMNDSLASLAKSGVTPIDRRYNRSIVFNTKVLLNLGEQLGRQVTCHFGEPFELGNKT